MELSYHNKNKAKTCIISQNTFSEILSDINQLINQKYAFNNVAYDVICLSRDFGDLKMAARRRFTVAEAREMILADDDSSSSDGSELFDDDSHLLFTEDADEEPCNRQSVLDFDPQLQQVRLSKL